MASSLLGAAVQLSVLMADPSGAVAPSADRQLCGSFIRTCQAEFQLQQDSQRSVSDLAPPASDLPRFERQRQRLLGSSLRLAASNIAARRNLQANFAFYTLRYALAMNHYFRVRHAHHDCTVQVAAWSYAIDAAQKANINSYLRDIPPDCPLR